MKISTVIPKAATLFLFILFTVPAAFSQGYTLQMAKQKLPGIERTFYIEQVIDNRLVKTSVGEVQTGMLNNKAAANFAQPLDLELSAFITASLPQQENQVPIILRVNKLWVSEHTTYSSETGTAEVVVDFLYKSDSVYHKLFAATAMASQQGLDVTKKHEENIARVLADCLKQFASRPFDAMLAQSQELTPDQVRKGYDNSAYVSEFPILKDGFYNEGVYLTLDEFRTNSPGITSSYTIKQRSSFDKVMVGGGDQVPVLISADGKSKPIKNAWGFSQNGELYINYGGAFYSLVYLDGKFSFLGPPANDMTAAVVTGAVLGGAIGGAVVGGIVGANARPGTYTLDLETGRISVDGKSIGTNTADAKLILFRESKAEQAQPVQVNVNGEMISLEMNQLVEYALRTTDGGTSVCLEASDDSCLSFMPIPGETYYIACSLNQKAANGQAELKLTDKAKGEFAVKGIKFSQAKESKKKKK
jgi:hypothetical protein